MKDGDADAAARSQGGQPGLGEIEFPAGCEDTAVFTAIRIAQHYLLLIVTGG